MTNLDTPWRPELPYNQLPTLPPVRELESRAVLKACIEARAALARGCPRSTRANWWT